MSSIWFQCSQYTFIWKQILKTYLDQKRRLNVFQMCRESCLGYRGRAGHKLLHQNLDYQMFTMLRQRRMRWLGRLKYGEKYFERRAHCQSWAPPTTLSRCVQTRYEGAANCEEFAKSLQRRS